MARETHCDRVLRVLSDGLPHTHHELYARTFTIVHSRISDLRRRGHTIDMWRDGDLYLYRLVPQGSAGTDPSALTPTPPVASAAAPARASTLPRGDERVPSVPAEQPAIMGLF